jgi:hypothetical protein
MVVGKIGRCAIIALVIQSGFAWRYDAADAHSVLKPSGSTLLTARFNIEIFYMVLTSHLCVLCSSEEERGLLLYTITDWYL